MRCRRLAAAIVCVAAPLLTGCFQSTTLVKLNPDGSGTIEQTLTMSTQALEQLQQFSAMGDKDKKSGATDDPFSVDRARATVSKMGNGVTFVSAAKIDAPDHKGLKTVYAFKDIRTLQLSEMNTPAGADMGGTQQKPMALTFTQLPNGHGLLTIRNDNELMKNMSTATPAAGGQSPFSGVDAAQATEMMKAMLGGMKMNLSVQVGHLVKTNIPYVDGGTVTIVSMDFDQMLANPAALDRMQQAKTIAETKAALREVKGIKVSLDPEMTIEFTK